MKTFKIILGLSILLVTSWASFVLDNGVGIKGQQVAGAYTAIAGGVDAIYWNPANLSFPTYTNAYVNYAKKFDEVSEYAGLWNIPLCDGLGIGFGYYHVGVDNIQQTDVSGSVLSTFGYETNVALLGVGWSMGDTLSMGLTVKGISQKAISQNTYFSTDLGLSVDLSREFKLGIVATDLINNAASREIKSGYRVGLGYVLPLWMVEADYDYKGILEKGFMRYGLTWRPVDMVSLKAGYSEYDKLLSAGLTLSLAGLELDYLYTNPDLGAVHQIGLQLGF